MSSLAWQIPLWACAIVVAVRLIMAPYWIWKEQNEKINALPIDSGLNERAIAAQEAHTEELRLQRQQRERENDPLYQAVQEKQKQAFASAPVKSPSIIIGQGAPYEKTDPSSDGRVVRRVSVGAKNNQNSFISNCKLYLDHTRTDGRIDPIPLSDTFSIPGGDEIFFPVAFHGDASRVINLNMSHYHSAFSYEHLPDADKKHIVTLRLQAHENIEVKETCYLWVDENGKLKLEKA